MAKTHIIEWLPNYPMRVRSFITLCWEIQEEFEEYKIFRNDEQIAHITKNAARHKGTSFGLYFDQPQGNGECTYLIIGFANSEEIARTIPKTIPSEKYLSRPGLTNQAKKRKRSHREVPENVLKTIKWQFHYPRVVSSNCEIKWSLLDEVDEYTIFRNNTLIVRLAKNKAQYKDSEYGLYVDSLKDPGEYIYIISGFAKDIRVAESIPKTVTIDELLDAPLPPYGLIGRLEGGKAALNWVSGTAEVIKYNIYRSKDTQSVLTLLASIPANTLKYRDSTIEPGVTYYYSVTAIDGYNNESKRSNICGIEFRSINTVREKTGFVREIETELVNIIYAVDGKGNSYSEDNPGGNLKGIDASHDKEVFVIELQQKDVQIFGQDGRFLTAYKGANDQNEGEGSLILPLSVCAAHNGDYFILDAESKKIVAINKQGKVLREFSVIPPLEELRYEVRALKMGIDREREVLFISDSGNSIIYLYDFKGNFIGSLGEQGHGNGQFSAPGKVWVDKKGKIYVIDGANCRIQVFTKEREFQYSFGELGSDAIGNFIRPAAIAVNSQGKIYVLDRLQHIIQVFSNGGAPVGIIKRPDGEHILKEPFDLSIDDEDNLYVCDAGNRRVIIFKDKE